VAGHWLVWSAHSAAGHPLLKTAGVSEAVGFSLFTETAGFQLETQIYVIALYDVAGTGMAELIWAAVGVAGGGRRRRGGLCLFLVLDHYGLLPDLSQQPPVLRPGAMGRLVVYKGHSRSLAGPFVGGGDFIIRQHNVQRAGGDKDGDFSCVLGAGRSRLLPRGALAARHSLLYGHVGRRRQLGGFPTCTGHGAAGFYWLLYLAVVSNLKPSAWVGITHNWAILPMLALEALCGHGGQWLAALWTKGRGLVLACGLVVVDLGGPRFCLNRLAMAHVPLEELPEVGIWRQVGARETDERPGQWFTYNSDHTHYLLPFWVGG